MLTVCIFLIFVVVTMPSFAECIFPEKECDIQQIALLRDQATKVWGSEGANCANIKGREERNACQSSYRLAHLDRFRMLYKRFVISVPIVVSLGRSLPRLWR